MSSMFNPFEKPHCSRLVDPSDALDSPISEILFGVSDPNSYRPVCEDQCLGPEVEGHIIEFKLPFIDKHVRLLPLLRCPLGLDQITPVEIDGPKE